MKSEEESEQESEEERMDVKERKRNKDLFDFQSIDKDVEFTGQSVP